MDINYVTGRGDIVANTFIGNQVRKARGERTQAELAEAVGISRTYLGDIETGRIEPSFTILCRIAEISGVDLNFFGEQIEITGIQKIIIFEVQGDKLMKKNDYLEMPVDGELIAIVIPDDSMAGDRIRKGDMAIVSKNQEGPIMAVKADGKIMVRRVHKDGNRMILTPSNPEFSPASFLAKQVETIGAVVRAVVKV